MGLFYGIILHLRLTKNAKIVGRPTLLPRIDAGYQPSMNVPTIKEALDYLYGLHPGGIKLGLENTRHLLRHFGDPQLKARTIHITGTNGKGSTAAFAESILRIGGHRVGLYTSPHLFHFSERIRVDGSPIQEKELAEGVFRIKQAVEALKINVTFFEFSTVLAFLYFQEKKTGWNVIEVGLGGRLDATNLCQAEISIITSIGLDHTQYLGTRLEGIAYEKAFIINNYGTVFAHIEDNAALDAVKKLAQERSAKLLRFGEDFHAELRTHHPRGQTVDFSFKDHHLRNLVLPLIGRHQVTNASLALAACLEVNSRDPKFDETAIRRGLNATRWEGRLEVAATNPTVILDCAHNPDGVIKLTQTVREYFSYSRIFLVLGVMKDKPIDRMLEIFSEFADRFILVKPAQERSEDPRVLMDSLRNRLACQKPIDIVEQIPYALHKAKQAANSEDLICVTGSIFTVAETKRSLANEAFF